MKKLILLFVLCLLYMPSIQASAICEQHLSPQEFRAKQKAFIIKQAGLTTAESALFFPIYFELQAAKKKLNDESWTLMRKGKEEKLSESDYERIVDKIADNRMASDRLDRDYLGKFKKILSWKKIYLIQRAEIRFHREMLRGINRSISVQGK